MQSTKHFIITPKGGQNFINEKEFNGGTLIINTSIEEAIDVNRIGIVVSLPLNYKGNIKVNDEVVVQHNVFRDWFDSKGRTRKASTHFKDNFYMVAEDLIFLICRGDEFIAIDEYCFVEPITEEKQWIGTVEVKHQGKVFFGNDYLKKEGVSVGDTIGFAVDSEYEFRIYDKKLYRIRNSNILIKIA